MNLKRFSVITAAALSLLTCCASDANNTANIIKNEQTGKTGSVPAGYFKTAKHIRFSITDKFLKELLQNKMCNSSLVCKNELRAEFHQSLVSGRRY